MWIKICGITSLEDANLAIAAGADAIGFVFAESPRRVTPESIREITVQLPDQLEKIGVFVNASLEEMNDVRHRAGLTGVQLHDTIGQPLNAGKNSLAGIRILRVVRYNSNNATFARELRKMREFSDGEEHAVLVDTWAEGKQGGTGCSFNWAAARESFLRQAPHLRLVVAGGLNPENVREAILTLQPWGVDVSSGVEKLPGKKDPGRLAAFIQAARAAETELLEAAGV